MIKPVQIKLAKHEAQKLLAYFHQTTDGKLKDTNVRNDLIMIAEHYDTLYIKVTKHLLIDGYKLVVYKFPLSLARILHTRLQQEPYNQVLQNILGNLDKELNNRNMVPHFPKQLSI